MFVPIVNKKYITMKKLRNKHKNQRGPNYFEQPHQLWLCLRDISNSEQHTDK